MCWRVIWEFFGLFLLGVCGRYGVDVKGLVCLGLGFVIGVVGCWIVSWGWRCLCLVVVSVLGCWVVVLVGNDRLMVWWYCCVVLGWDVCFGVGWLVLVYWGCVVLDIWWKVVVVC